MKRMYLVFILLFFTISCASRHSRMNNTVALQINESNGIACIDSSSLIVGQKLSLMNYECSENELMSDAMTSCPLKKYGEVKITKIINDHYVEFVADSGIKFEEGSYVKSQP